MNEKRVTPESATAGLRIIEAARRSATEAVTVPVAEVRHQPLS